jgi:hypothetical protein
MRYPLQPAPRVAVLEPGFTLPKIVQRMRHCGAIAAPVSVLKRLASAVSSGEVSPPSLENAVIVFTGTRHGELSELERDLFWRVFQVPVFEQFFALDGRLIAMECEAHQGLHLVAPPTALAGFQAVLDSTPCGCGDPNPRIIGLRAEPLPS